jgi:hypothetical protein
MGESGFAPASVVNNAHKPIHKHFTKTFSNLTFAILLLKNQHLTYSDLLPNAAAFLTGIERLLHNTFV